MVKSTMAWVQIEDKDKHTNKEVNGILVLEI